VSRKYVVYLLRLARLPFRHFREWTFYDHKTGTAGKLTFEYMANEAARTTDH
jgi:hypothetical protein